MRRLLLIACLLTAAIPMVMTPGCTRDGIVVTDSDGGFRKAFQDRNGNWYYVRNGRKVYLEGEPTPGSPARELRDQHSNFLPQ